MVLCDTEGCSQGLHQSCASSVDFGFHTDKEKEWFCVSCTEGTEAGTSVGTVRYIDGRFGGLGAVQMMNDPKGTKTKKNDKANVRFAFVRSDAPNTPNTIGTPISNRQHNRQYNRQYNRQFN